MSDELTAWLHAEISKDLKRQREQAEFIRAKAPETARMLRAPLYVAEEMAARCEAEMAILSEHAGDPCCGVCHSNGWSADPAPCRTVEHLAGGYRHRPGYREEWKP